MTKEGLCPSCVHSVWCPTWAEYKCLEKKRFGLRNDDPDLLTEVKSENENA